MPQPPTPCLPHAKHGTPHVNIFKNVKGYLTEFYFTDSTRYGMLFFKIMNLIE